LDTELSRQEFAKPWSLDRQKPWFLHTSTAYRSANHLQQNRGNQPILASPLSSAPLPACGVRGQVLPFLARFWRVRDRDDGVMPMFDELTFDEVTSPSLLGDRLINPTGFL
jgi:hypothetical protein